LSRKRILFFDHTAKMSGGERSLLLILEKIDKKKFHPFLVTPQTGEFTYEAERLGIERYLVHIPSFVLKRKRSNTGLFFLVLSLVATIPAIILLAIYAKKHRICIIYTNSQKAHLIGLCAGMLSNIAVVWHFRDILSSSIARQVVKGLGLIFTYRIIAISEAVASQFKRAGYLSKKVSVVYNSIDVEGFKRKCRESITNLKEEYELPEDAKIVASIGQIARWKGQEYLIRAAHELTKRFDNAYFFIIGKRFFGGEDYEKEIKKLLYDLKLGQRVFFTGYRSDIPGIMSDIDILVHTPQEPEPFGRVLIEAMAAGTPVVAFDTGAAKEVLPDNMGMLVPAFDTKTLVKAISKLLKNDKLYQKTAQRAREYVKEKFDFPRLLRSIESVLRHETQDR